MTASDTMSFVNVTLTHAKHRSQLSAKGMSGGKVGQDRGISEAEWTLGVPGAGEMSSQPAAGVGVHFAAFGFGGGGERWEP